MLEGVSVIPQLVEAVAGENIAHLLAQEVRSRGVCVPLGRRGEFVVHDTGGQRQYHQKCFHNSN